jgi:hypothetical protein
MSACLTHLGAGHEPTAELYQRAIRTPGEIRLGAVRFSPFETRRLVPGPTLEGYRAHGASLACHTARRLNGFGVFGEKSGFAPTPV